MVQHLCLYTIYSHAEPHTQIAHGKEDRNSRAEGKAEALGAKTNDTEGDDLAFSRKAGAVLHSLVRQLTRSTPSEATIGSSSSTISTEDQQRALDFNKPNDAGHEAKAVARTAMEFRPSDGPAPEADIFVKTSAAKTIIPESNASSTIYTTLQLALPDEFADVTYTISARRSQATK